MRKMLVIGAAAIGGGLALAAAAFVGFRAGLEACWSMLDIGDLMEDDDLGAEKDDGKPCAVRDCSKCARERCLDCKCGGCCEACPYPKGACDCHPDGVPGWENDGDDPGAWGDEPEDAWDDGFVPCMGCGPDGEPDDGLDDGGHDGCGDLDDDMMPEDMIEDYDPDQYL